MNVTCLWKYTYTYVHMCVCVLCMVHMGVVCVVKVRGQPYVSVATLHFVLDRVLSLSLLWPDELDQKLPETPCLCLPFSCKSTGLPVCANVPGFMWVLVVHNWALTHARKVIYLPMEPSSQSLNSLNMGLSGI